MLTEKEIAQVLARCDERFDVVCRQLVAEHYLDMIREGVPSAEAVERSRAYYIRLQGQRADLLKRLEPQIRFLRLGDRTEH
jgi:hypothetical protein